MTISDNERQRVVQRMTTSGNEWYNERKRHSALQRMDDCHHYYDKNRYTTSRDGRPKIKWLK